MTCQNCIMAEGVERLYIWCILRKMHYGADHTCHAWCASGLTPAKARDFYDSLLRVVVNAMAACPDKWRKERDLVWLVEARLIMRKKADKDSLVEKRRLGLFAGLTEQQTRVDAGDRGRALDEVAGELGI